MTIPLEPHVVIANILNRGGSCPPPISTYLSTITSVQTRQTSRSCWAWQALLGQIESLYKQGIIIYIGYRSLQYKYLFHQINCCNKICYIYPLITKLMCYMIIILKNLTAIDSWLTRAYIFKGLYFVSKCTRG